MPRAVTKFRKERGGSKFRTGIFRGGKTGMVIIGHGGYACVVYAVNETPPTGEAGEDFEVSETGEHWELSSIYPDCPP